MSAETIKAIKDAIQAHIDEGHEEGDPPEFLLEFAVGYAAVVTDHHHERFAYRYITDPNSTPHSSVGLFAMSAAQLDMDLHPDD